MDNDIFIVYAYCSPANSSVWSSEYMPSDIYEDLTNKLATCNANGSTILLGDLNARTKLLPDYIENENNDHVPVPPPTLYDTDTVATETRFNMDSGTNSYGAKFIDLCKSVPLRILNGRKLGDLLGNFTCYKTVGSSCVDFGAVSPEIFDKIPYFSVAPPCLSLSDHTPIELGLKVNVRRVPVENSHNMSAIPDKLVWDRNLTQKFKTLIESPDCKTVLTGFVNTGVLPTQDSVDSAVSLLSNIIVETAKQAGMQVKKGAVPRRSARANFLQVRQTHPKWHDTDCQALFKQIKQTSTFLKYDQKKSLFTRSNVYFKQRI